MRTVHKFKLPITDVARVTMPTVAKVVHIGAQGIGQTNFWIWAEVDTNYGQKEDRLFAVVGTGNPMPQGWAKCEHRATVIDGVFVWHVYEVSR